VVVHLKELFASGSEVGLAHGSWHGHLAVPEKPSVIVRLRKAALVSFLVPGSLFKKQVLLQRSCATRVVRE